MSYDYEQKTLLCKRCGRYFTVSVDPYGTAADLPELCDTCNSPINNAILSVLDKEQT